MELMVHQWSIIHRYGESGISIVPLFFLWQLIEQYLILFSVQAEDDYFGRDVHVHFYAISHTVVYSVFR
jgi:hypothetical protein